jgi:AraC-like DNA-binding protein
MSEKHSANMILSLTRRNQVYLPYARKKPYFEAIAAGNAEAVDRLAEKNSGYTAALSAKCASEEEAIDKMRYGAIGAASEFCLVAIQAGLLDMVAYDIRDEMIAGLEDLESLDDYYEFVHKTAREYARRMSYVIKEKNYSPRLVRMMTYIKEHLGEKIELSAIAEHVNVSRTYASAVFRDELGITISEFILRERMSEAERMLRETDLSVADIGSRLGFCSQSYFTKRFTESKGETPLEYRRQQG